MHWLLLSQLLALSATYTLAAAPGPLDVNLTSGTFRGATTDNGTEHWLGIPYAQPPVGNLRFKAPVAIKTPHKGLQNATAFGDACPQAASSTLGAPVGENCLFLNVWRPTNTTASEKLPVLVWIHGGYFMQGAASDPAFDPTRMIQRSVSNGKPILFVSLNYRVNTFGFIASEHLAVQDLNAGLQDQRLALEFVQDNIAAFGGDPTKVTLWGQSAGAGGAETQLVYFSPRKLFRAAIMDSTTGPFKTSPVPSTYDKANGSYTRLVDAVGCPQGSGSLSCLKQVPIAQLMNVSNTMYNAILNKLLWAAAPAPGNMINELSSTRIAQGNFMHIPLIAGSNLNDGSMFSTSLSGLNLTGPAQDKAFQQFVLAGLVDASRVTPDVLDELTQLYPANDSALGAPFNTGDSLFDRGSAYYGENSYLAPRRRLFEAAAGKQDLWAYYFTEFLPGESKKLGVRHGSELKLLLGPTPSDVEADFTNTFLDFWLNFVNDLNPGSAWTKWTSQNKQALQLMRDNLTMIPDDFGNLNRTNYLNSAKVLEESIR